MSTVELNSIESRGGTQVKGVNNLSDLIERSGFGFEVEKAQLYTPEGDELHNTYMLRRTDTHKPLNVVRGRYQIVSNEQMLEPFDRMVKEYGASYENSGMIGDGKICWVSAVLPNSFEAKKGDTIEQRIVAMVYHDGTRRNSYFQYAHRVWCNNQLRTLNKAARDGYTIGHTKNWNDQIEVAREKFVGAIESSNELSRQIKKLSSHKMSNDQAGNFLEHMFPIVKDVTDRVVTRISNVRDQVDELFKNGVGNEGVSRWDMLNAVTEYFDHHKTTKRNASTSRQFVNEMIGMGNTPKKTRAFNLLTDHGDFSAIDPKRN